MKTVLLGLALAWVLLGAGLGAVLHEQESAAQALVSIGVDTDPAGNTATSLGSIDPCVSVSEGSTFQVDIFVTDVTDLLAWETNLTYDVKVIDILDRDVMMFQDADPGSQVFDASEGLPDLDGWYRVAAADIAEPPTPERGSGVLARLSLKAVAPGISSISLSPVDADDDGKMELGPTLRGADGDSIDDRDGDGFFDGPIFNAEIAVDAPCPSGVPTSTPGAARPSPSATPVISATPTPEATTGSSPTGQNPEGDDGTAWASGPAIIGYVLGGLAALLLAALGVVRIRARRPR